MNIYKVAFVAFSCSLMFGCASGAKIENMSFRGEQKSYSEEIKKNIELGNVDGGQKTNPLWTSEIGNEEFSAAVKETLELQGLYSDSGKYVLKVKMVSVDQPLFGLDLKVTTNVRYTLTDAASSQVVLDEFVQTPYTAGVGDAVIAVKRLRLANEGSARKNIENLLEKLSKLNIDKEQVSLRN